MERTARFGWLTLATTLATAASLFAAGCPAVTQGPAGRSRAAEADRERFRRVAGAAPAAPDREALLAEALEGTVDETSDDLAARMSRRRLPIPTPPRGATSRFNFDGGRRGFVTALPNAEVLTSPAYGEGKIFLGGGFASHHFFAFDAFTGELDWAMAAPDGGPTAAIVHRRDVIFNTESCTLFVADVDTGELRWKRWLGDPLMSQPAIAGDLVLSAYPSGGAHRFGAFRLTDGEPAWDVPIPADVIQAPHVRGEDVFFATMDGTVFRLRARDGRVAWSKQVGASSAVWVTDDRLLVSTRADEGERSFEVPVVLGARDGRELHRGARVAAPYFAGQSRDRQLGAGQAGAWGGVPSGAHLGLANVAAGWAFQGSSPAVADGRAYEAIGSRIRARDVRTGREVWSRDYGEAAGAQAISPPAVVGAQVIFGTVDGHLYFADIDTGMIVRAYEIGDPIVFQPIVAQGWVYVATGRGNLVGLELGDPSFDGWHMWGGNAQHAGLVETAGRVDPHLLASLERPSQGTLRVARFEETESDADSEGDSDSESAGKTSSSAATPANDREAELPLVRTRVRASVSGFVAEVTVTQRFENPHDRPIEAIYLFPLPDDAAVDDMEMVVGSRVIRGRIRRRAQARQEYEEARSEGRRASLLEQQRPNLFAQRVANVQPHEAIEVRIRYVQQLPYENGAYEMVYPLVSPARYVPGAPTAPSSRPAMRASGEVDLEVVLDAGLPLGDVASPSHPIEVERRGAEAAVVTVGGRGSIPNQDFVLRYAVAGDVPRATVLTERTGDAGHLGLVVMPPAAPDDAAIAPRQIVFAVDASSSMRGRPMEHARAAIRRVLGQLRPGDTFQILAFADEIERVLPAPAAPDPATVREALARLDAVRAVGSTEMVPAVRAALEESAANAGDRLPIVVLVTDGFIGNEGGVLRAIAEGIGRSRLHALGVGTAVNRFLLTRAAELGRGRATVIAPSEDPVEVSARFAASIDRPVFTDVEIDWGGLDVRDVHPRRMPDLFAGQPITLHARFAEAGRATVKVRGTMGGVRYERTVDVELPGADTPADRRSHATLWARAAVRDRMNQLYLREEPAIVEEVTELGLRYRMMTPYTSFVAVEETLPDARTANAQAEARPTVTPGRALPGDPEIRVPAPRDARAVTIVLPFGETLAAAYEPDLAMWTARFLIPADASEGSYPIDVLITHADGRQERMRVWYTVDSSAPAMDLEVVGDAVPGATVRIRATQRVTEADLRQVGTRIEELTPARAQLLADARRVEARLPDGSVLPLELAAPGVFEGDVTVPIDAAGLLELDVVVVDLAANVRTQALRIEVSR